MAQDCQAKETVVYQNNTSTIQLENNSKLNNSSYTKYINVRYYFIKDCVNRKKLQIEFCGTDNLWTDFYTKPLQEKNYSFRRTIWNLEN